MFNGGPDTSTQERIIMLNFTHHDDTVFLLVFTLEPKNDKGAGIVQSKEGSQ